MFNCLKILCCHPNGYIRYKAIHALAETSIQDAIPFLMIRANDWVEDIRILCFDTLNRIIKVEFIHYFLALLPLLQQLKIKNRTGHLSQRLEFISKTESLLVSQCSDAIFEKMNSLDIKLARYAFSILANSQTNIEQLLITALNNTDVILHVYAFNLASQHYDPHQFLIYLNKIKDDKKVNDQNFISELGNEY